MNARRLFLALLILMMALPITGVVAQETMTNLWVEYPTGETNEFGEQVFTDAIMGVQYSWTYTDDYQSGIWLKINPGFPAMEARVNVTLYNMETGMETVYQLYDAMSNSTLINVMSLESGMDLSGFMLKTGDEPPVPSPVQLTLSNRDLNEVVGGTGEYTDPEWTDPTIGDTDPEWTDPGADDTDPNWTDPNAYNPDPEYDPDLDAAGGIGILSASQDEVAPPTIPVFSEEESLPERETEFGRVNMPITALYDYYGSETYTEITPEDVFVRVQNEPQYQPVYDSVLQTWWVPVRLLSDETRTGYIPLTDFTFMTTADKDAYDLAEQQKNQRPMPDRASNYALTNKNASLQNASQGAAGTLENKTFVQFLENNANDHYFGSDGTRWVLIQYGDAKQQNYINVDDLTFITAAEAEDYLNPPETVPSDRPTDYAKVTELTTQLVGSNNQAIRTLRKGDVVLYNRNGTQQYDASKKLWVTVTVDDNATVSDTGLVRLADIQFMTTDEVKTHNDSKNPVVEEKPTLDRAFYARVLQNNANVRPSADTTSTPNAQLTKGRIVLVQDLKYNGDSPFYYIEILEADGTKTGKTGYIPADKAIVDEITDTAAQSEFDSNKVVTKEPTKDPTKEPTKDPTKEPTKEPTKKPELPALTQVRGFMSVNASQYAQVNAAPLHGSAMVGYLTRGDVVYADGQYYDESGDGTVWALVTPMDTGGRTGYVEYKYLTAMTQSEITAYFNAKVPTAPPSPTYSPNAYSGYGILVKNSVNFRSSPSGSSSVMTRLAQGTVVRILSEATGDGYTWYQCESGGRTGYLRSDMVATLSISEYLSMVTTPSYNQNGTIITPTATANLGGTNIATWTAKPNATNNITFVTLPPTSSASPNPSASPDASASIDPNASPDASGGVIAGLSPSPDTSLSPSASATFPTEATGSSSPSLAIALGAILVLGAGGAYGYSVYNKTRRKATEEQVKKLADSQTTGQAGDKPAVRRPVPPTGTNATNATKAGAAAGAAGAAGMAASKGQQQRPGTPGSTAPKPGQPNPYARPQSSTPPTQDVRSNMPRAQVDGKPVGQNGATSTTAQTTGNGQNPYATRQQTGQGQAPGTPGAYQTGQGAPGGQTPGGQPTAQGQNGTRPQGMTGSDETVSASSSFDNMRMPVAPPPVQPDATATGATQAVTPPTTPGAPTQPTTPGTTDASAPAASTPAATGEGEAPAPRRRRRRASVDGDTPTQTPDQEPPKAE